MDTNKSSKAKSIDTEYIKRSEQFSKVDAAKYEKYIESKKSEFNKMSKRAFTDKIRGRALSEGDQRWLDVLRSVGGVKGSAVAGLTDILFKNGHVENGYNGVKLSEDLLTGMSESALESLTVLIRDGWSGSIGELLSCAKSL